MDYETMAFEGLIELLHERAFCLVADLEKVARGNKTAAQRVRLKSIELAKATKVFRKRSMKEVSKGG